MSTATKAVLFFVLASSTCFGQVVQLKSEPVLAIVGARSPEIVQGLIIVEGDSKVSTTPAASVTVSTDYKFKRIKATKDGKRIDLPAIVGDRMLFTAPGSYVIEVTVYDPERGIDDSEIAFTVGPTKPIDPDIPPDVPDQPSGKFDGLADRVNAITRTMSTSDRMKWASTMATVISKMTLFEVKRIEEVQALISAADLTTNPEASGKKLEELLKTDASQRVLSWAETIDWYKEIKKGIER